MADLDINFQYAPALRALKYGSRRRLMAALRAAKLSNYAHVILLCNDTKPAVILRSKATKNVLLHFPIRTKTLTSRGAPINCAAVLTPFAAPLRLKTFPT